MDSDGPMWEAQRDRERDLHVGAVWDRYDGRMLSQWIKTRGDIINRTTTSVQGKRHPFGIPIDHISATGNSYPFVTNTIVMKEVPAADEIEELAHVPAELIRKIGSHLSTILNRVFTMLVNFEPKVYVMAMEPSKEKSVASSRCFKSTSSSEASPFGRPS